MEMLEIVLRKNRGRSLASGMWFEKNGVIFISLLMFMSFLYLPILFTMYCFNHAIQWFKAQQETRPLKQDFSKDW